MIAAGKWIVKPQERRGKFPGVDIDAIHYERGAIRDAREIAAMMRHLAKKAA